MLKVEIFFGTAWNFCPLIFRAIHVIKIVFSFQLLFFTFEKRNFLNRLRFPFVVKDVNAKVNGKWSVG